MDFKILRVYLKETHTLNFRENSGLSWLGTTPWFPFKGTWYLYLSEVDSFWAKRHKWWKDGQMDREATKWFNKNSFYSFEIEDLKTLKKLPTQRFVYLLNIRNNSVNRKLRSCNVEPNQFLPTSVESEVPQLQAEQLYPRACRKSLSFRIHYQLFLSHRWFSCDVQSA